MSIAGIIDAMRANVQPSIRIVWQCLENHANGARWWRMTERDIATELHLSPKTVERAVIALEGKGEDAVLPAVVQVRRCKRRPATFTMLRSYPEGCPKPRHEPEVAARVAPELTRQNGDSTTELTRQIDDSLFPPVKNPPVEQERGPPAAPPARAPSPILVFSMGEGEEEAAPDGWQPSPEVHQAAVEAGYSDPAEVRDELHDLETRDGPPPRPHPIPETWQPNAADRSFATERGLDPDRMAPLFVNHHLARGGKERNWSARWRVWCLREPSFQRQPSGNVPPFKPETEAPVIEGEVLSVDGLQPRPPSSDVAVEVSQPHAEACDWIAATPQELHAAMQRIRELWPDSRKRPPDHELRDALAGYAAPILHCAISNVRNHVPYASIRVADFVKAAQSVAQEAWRQANPLPPTPERAPTPTAAEREQARKQLRREALNAKLMAAPDVAGLFALIWPQGVGLKRVSDGHARALLRLALQDMAAARSLAVACVAYWTEDGPAPDLTGLEDTGSGGDPAAMFAALAL